MSSSTFASERAGEDWRWRRLIWRYAVSTVVLGVVLGGLLLTLDPYDTGHFSLFPHGGVPDFGQRQAFASIARRPDVNTAVIGNSTIQLLDPARLSQLSGRKVVSLAVPGTGPVEQLAVARWFLRHHEASKTAFVFGLDASWCATDAPIKLLHPFPFWLYTDDRADYALNMMRYKTFEAAGRRLKVLLGREHAARADGYHDYDTDHAWQFAEYHGQGQVAEPGGPPPAAKDFTAATLLRQFVAGLDPASRVVLLIPPQHVSGIPPTDSAAEAVLAACKQVYRDIAATRPNTALLDFFVDSPMVRPAENFHDTVHYRGPVARQIEVQLADVLRP